MKAWPKQRTMEWLRDQGYHAGSVEQFNAHVGPFGKRFDLFGFADLCAFHPDKPGCVLIQCSTAGGRKDHYRKIMESDLARAWIRDISRGLALASWGQKVVRNKDGSKAKVKRWQCMFQLITEIDFKTWDEENNPF